MNIHKIIGFALLGFGVSVILYGLYASYGIFTGQNDAPRIFREQESNSPGADNTAALGSLEDLQNQLPGLLQSQLQGLLPAGSIPGMLNLFSWSVFAGILMLGGGQIAGLGIKLIK
ncbi:MAG: hypothetical protein HY482_01190 [Candidatus Wildermuthbacteria bacterium]|nr:hypothetical protein [Candidatus Wildermuthbacteria bacterium]